MKNNFLFITKESLISDVARACQDEGKNVRYYIESKEDSDIADGFVEKVSSWKEHIDWADTIIFDDTLGQGEVAQGLREQGKAVIGGSPYTDKLEDDRAFGQAELKSQGINIIPQKDFTSFDEAIQFVQENPHKYVLKPSGQAGNLKGLLFVGQEADGSDMLQVLRDYKQAWEHKIPSFQMQRRVEGVEVAVGAFFNGTEFMEPINVNFENKKLFPGNLGPSTGEMGTFMFWSDPNRMYIQTLQKFESKLAQEGYVGYIDLNCIVNRNGIYPLEFTSRFGYPTIFIQQEGINMPISDFLSGMADGSLKQFKTKTGFQIGVRLCVPPFPFTDPETFAVKSKDTVIHFKKGKDGAHIEDVKLVNGEWVITGSSGVVMTVTGSGTTMQQAQQQVYNRIKNIIIPHVYYRDDIGERWYNDRDKLHNWGYLR